MFRRPAHVTAQGLYQQGRLALERGEFSSAEQDAAEGYRLFGPESVEWEWRFRVLRAEALVWRGMSNQAFPLIAAEPPQGLSYETIIRRQVVLGLAACFLQQFSKSDELLGKAQILALQHQPGLLGDVFLAKGVAAVVRSNYPVAKSSFVQALQLARQQNNLLLQASALGNLGIVETRLQHYDKAIDWYNATMKISESLGNRASVAKVKGNLGWCYLMLGDSDRALELLQQAEKESAALGAVKDQQVWLTNLGIAYWTKQRYDLAETSLSKALDIARNLQNKTLEAITLNELTRTAIIGNRLDRAEQYEAQVEQLNSVTSDRTYALYSTFNRASIEEALGRIPEAERLFQQVVAKSQENIALKWQAEAELADLSVKKGAFTIAEAQFKKALRTIDGARASLSKEETRLSFLDTASEFYNDYIDYLVSRGRVEDALAVAEHSRARTLAEGLGIEPAALVPNTIRPTELARRQHAVLLAYWLKPVRSYLWAITPTRVALFHLPADSTIRAAVQAYREALVGPRDPLQTGNAAGQQLYEILVAPAKQLIPANSRVVIIPDDSLYNLNFETLLTPSPKLHYWIDDVIVSDANSLALLNSPDVRSPGTNQSKLLLIGNPIAASSEFPPLPQAESEIREVASHFTSANTSILEGAMATPEAYLASDPGQYSYIHFVAHGTASRVSPLDSAVVLSPRGDTYKLYARDIIEKPLRADLITISACYGSGSRAYSGEGLVGLAWAFLRAGAKNVIASLWEANDLSTPKLMNAMYDGIRRGEDPAAALRQAKMSLLHSDNIYRRPFYWAPFQLYEGSGFRIKKERPLSEQKR